MEHRLITGGEYLYPLARSLVAKLKKLGLPYASQKFEVDGVSIQVRIEPGHEYIRIEGGAGRFWVLVATVFVTVTGTGFNTLTTIVRKTKLFRVDGLGSKVTEYYSGESTTEGRRTSSSTSLGVHLHTAPLGGPLEFVSGSQTLKTYTSGVNPAITTFAPYGGKAIFGYIEEDYGSSSTTEQIEIQNWQWTGYEYGWVWGTDLVQTYTGVIGYSDYHVRWGPIGDDGLPVNSTSYPSTYPETYPYKWVLVDPTLPGFLYEFGSGAKMQERRDLSATSYEYALTKADAPTARPYSFYWSLGNDLPKITYNYVDTPGGKFFTWDGKGYFRGTTDVAFTMPPTASPVYTDLCVLVEDDKFKFYNISHFAQQRAQDKPVSVVDPKTFKGVLDDPYFSAALRPGYLSGLVEQSGSYPKVRVQMIVDQKDMTSKGTNWTPRKRP